jgi:hypothetical protein
MSLDISVGGVKKLISLVKGGAEPEAYQRLRNLKEELPKLMLANENGSIPASNLLLQIKAGIEGVPNLPWHVNAVINEIEDELKKENPNTKNRFRGLMLGLTDFTDELNQAGQGRTRRNRKQTRKNRKTRKSRRVNRNRK